MSRRCIISVRKTKGCNWPPDRVLHNGQHFNIADIFSASGIEVKIDYDRSDLQTDQRWSSLNLSELHQLMQRHQSPDVQQGSWNATALIVPAIAYVSGGHLRRPMGVMFDIGAADLNRIPREGCAVAFNSVGDDPTLYLRTLAHEIGHVFNLLHPDEESPPVKRGQTLMVETRDLARDRTFPQNIQFKFSEANSEWLANGPDEFVRPGGRPYGSRPGTSRISSSAPTDSAIELCFEPISCPILPYVPIEFAVQMRKTEESRTGVACDLQPSGGKLLVEVWSDEEGWQRVPSVVRECGCQTTTRKQFVSLPGLYVHERQSRRFRARYSDSLNPDWDGLISSEVELQSVSPRNEIDLQFSEICRSFDVRLALCWRGLPANSNVAGNLLNLISRSRHIHSAQASLLLALATMWSRKSGEEHETHASTILNHLAHLKLADHHRLECDFISEQFHKCQKTSNCDPILESTLMSVHC